MNLVQIFSLFNTQPNRPRALPASFKHVGQTPLLKGLQILGKRADQNFGPFLHQGPRWLNLVSTHNLIGLGPSLQASSLYGRPSTQGASNLWKWADQNFGPFLPPGPWWLNLLKVFSLFNTQPNRPRALPASFKHVGQTFYSRGFKFGEKGPVKILVHFCLQVRGG